MLQNDVSVRPPSAQHLGQVTSVEGVGDTGRIEVRLHDYDGVATQDATFSARLCVPMSGAERGAFLCPDVGQEVLVSFINGDPRQAVVLGALWNGKAKPPETLGGNGKAVDRWTLVGRKGTRIAIEEEGEAGALIRLSTRSGGQDVATCVIDRESGGFIEMSAGGTTVRIDQSGFSVETSGEFKVQATSGNITASSVDISAGQTTCSGALTVSASVTTPSVVASSYSPGAGNVW